MVEDALANSYLLQLGKYRFSIQSRFSLHIQSLLYKKLSEKIDFHLQDT